MSASFTEFILAAPPMLEALAQRVSAEYRLVPGLSLNAAEAAFSWSIDPGIAEMVLQRLVRDGVLRRNPDGCYRLPPVH